MPRKKLEESEKKSRITLNINENLLNKIDNIIKDGENRSKLIESLLEKYINDNSNKLKNY